MGGRGGEFEFNSSSSSIRYSTSAREGGSSVRVQSEIEFSLSSIRSSFFVGWEGGSSSSVRVRVQFDILLLLGEVGSSSSVRVRVQFEFSSNSVRDRTQFEFNSKLLFCGGGGGVRVQFKFEFNSIFYLC